MSDPVEVLLTSPRSTKAMQQLGFSKEDLRYLSKEELKAKLGDMKITKQALNQKWEDYESDRKDKIARILEVRVTHFSHIPLLNSFAFRKEREL